MKKLLLITPFFPPQHAAASLRTASFARAWSQMGADVTVLTTKKRPDQRGMPVSIPGIKVQEINYQIKDFLERARADHKQGQRDESAAGRIQEGSAAKVKRWTGAYSAARMPDVTDAWVAPAVQWAKDNGPWDVVVSSIGPYTAHLVALKLKRGGAALRWVADYRDLWTGNHIYHGLFPFTLREKFLERQCLAVVDHVTAVSAPLANWLRQRTKAPVDVVPNGFDPTNGRSVGETSESVDEFRLVYTGSIHQRGQSPVPLLKALKLLDQRNKEGARTIRLVIAGSSEPQWRECASRLGIEHMLDSRGVIPQQEALDLQASADALVVLDWDQIGAGVLTTKLCEYLPCTSPVLAVGGRQGVGDCVIEQVLQSTGRGVHLGSDEHHIADVIESLVANPDSLGIKANQREVDAYQRPEIARKMWRYLDNETD